MLLSPLEYFIFYKPLDGCLFLAVRIYFLQNFMFFMAQF